jgi:hypothetical protein
MCAAPTVEPDGTPLDANQPFTALPEVAGLLRTVLAEHAQGRLGPGPRTAAIPSAPTSVPP